MPTGTSISYVSGAKGRPLPTQTTYTPHRPWCVDCKRKHDPEQLDTNQRCSSCAAAAIERAAAAEVTARREAREALEAKHVPPTSKLPKAGKQGQPTTRRSAPRAKPTSSNTRRARVAGSATPREKNPPAVRETRPAAAGGPQRPGPRPGGHQATTDTTRIRRLYLEGNSIPEVARATGHAQGTIRRVLIGSKIELRDDRRTKSGSKPVEHGPEVVEAVRCAYLDEQLSIRQVADKLGIQHKSVAKILHRHDIPRRPDAFSPGYQRKDQAAPLKARIAELGVPVRDIKNWAIRVGLLMEMQVGLPPASIVEAYAAAHGHPDYDGFVQPVTEVATPEAELAQFATAAPAFAVRAWAVKHGHPAGGRGPVPRETRLAFARHHYERTRSAS